MLHRVFYCLKIASKNGLEKLIGGLLLAMNLEVTLSKNKNAFKEGGGKDHGYRIDSTCYLAF